LLNQLRADPTVQFHREAINQISVGLDIWEESNTTNENAHLIFSQALRSFAAHASTQHNNKRLVKLGALMSSTGKSDMKRTLTLKYPPTNQRWNYYRGRKKLLYLEREANKKSNQLASIATNWARKPTTHASKQLVLALSQKPTIFSKGVATGRRER
jgi:hypothetical protein